MQTIFLNLQMKNKKWVTETASKVSSATYNSFREVLCDLPIQYFLNRKFAGPLKIEISISNDGKAKSNKKTLVVFDSRCFSCQGGSKLCERKVLCNLCVLSDN